MGLHGCKPCLPMRKRLLGDFLAPWPKKTFGTPARQLSVIVGPHPQYGWDFPEEIREIFRKEPGNALRAFPPLKSTAGIPQTLQFKALTGRLQSISRILSLQYGWERFFFRSGSGEGLSESVMEFPAVLGVSLNCANLTGRLIFHQYWC